MILQRMEICTERCLTAAKISNSAATTNNVDGSNVSDGGEENEQTMTMAQQQQESTAFTAHSVWVRSPGWTTSGADQCGDDG
jgi:hypothetical protein